MSGKSASPETGDAGTGAAASGVFAALSVPNFRRYVAPVGSPVIGALSDAAGPRSALGLGAAACVAAAAVGCWPARR